MKQIQNVLNGTNENKENKNVNNNPLILDSRDSVHNYLDFVRKKEKMGAIEVKEHSHKLVYCISILNFV